MNHTLKKIVLITAAVAVVSLGIAGILFFTTSMNGAWELKGGITVDEQQSFLPEGINEINVQTSSIDVFIGNSEASSIEMYLHGSVHSSRSEAIPKLTVELSGDTLDITTERENGQHFVLGFYSDEVVLEIRVPEQYRNRLVVRTSSGDVDIIDQNLSELSVDTSSGDIQLRSIKAATISLESSSGDQEAESIQAENSELTSTSGDVWVRDLQGGARVKSSSGEITIRYFEFNADMEVRSSSGDVKLYLTEAAQFRLEAKASSGDIRCEFPVSLAGGNGEMSRNIVVGMVGDGIHQVAVQTSSGDITIRP
jgi:lia operon protein LiaG